MLGEAENQFSRTARRWVRAARKGTSPSAYLPPSPARWQLLTPEMAVMIGKIPVLPLRAQYRFSFRSLQESNEENGPSIR